MASCCALLFVALSSHAEVVRGCHAEPALDPFRGSLNPHVTEYVDPFLGTLQLRSTELFIPGNGGMDINVARQLLRPSASAANSIDRPTPGSVK
jgi:hypothetical protein